MALEVSRLSLAIKRDKILEDISFSVNAGEILCLLGPSGSGKTTLLRAIIGELPYHRGAIHIDGKMVPYGNMSKDLGYMPQEIALYEDITAYDNLKFFADLYSLSKPKGRIDELLSILGLGNDVHKVVENFSGGMKRRLSLAITLLHKPKLLILDEPTVGIDPVLREAIWSIVEQLRNQGSIILVSTHIMNDADRCSRVAIIKNGRIADIGKVEELNKKYQASGTEEMFLKANKQFDI